MSVVYYTDPEYFERLDGRDYPKVSPRTSHGLVQLALAMILRRVGREVGKVVPELRVRVGAVDGTDSHLIPDVSFVTNEQWKLLVTDRDKEEPPFSPAVAVEVRSPGQSASLRRRKVERYLATGALAVLDADPAKRTIAVIDRAGERIFASGERLRVAALPWLAFDVAEAFEDLDDL